MAERGRPSIFTEELAARICERLAMGESLRQLCRDADMPDFSTVKRWLGKNDEFRAQYARAREDQADYMADEAIDAAREADKDNAAAVRVHLDAIKWLAGKLSPKKYGDKQTHEIGGVGGGPVVFQWQPPQS